MRRRRGLLVGLLVCAGLMLAPAVAGAATISESFSSPSVALNGSVTLTFTIENPGGSPHVVNFDDTLPTGLQVAGTPSTTCAAGVLLPGGSSDISFTDPALADPSCTVSATILGAQAGQWDNPVTETDDLGSSSTDGSLDVIAPPSISAAFGTGLLGLDGTTPLTFTITNPNPSFALSGVGFTDTLPAGLVIAGQPSAGDTCAGAVAAAPGTDSLGLSGGQLSPGSSCTVSATIVATATGALSDTSTQVTSTEGGVGNTASAGLTVIGPPTIAVASPTSGRVYAFGQAVRASYRCADDPSGPGVASCAGNVPSGALIDTSNAGTHAFTVTATSEDGGVATDIVFYSVAPDNRFKLGRAHVHPGGTISFALKLPGPGRITVLETVRGSRLVFARGGAVARRAGTVGVTIKPTARGRRALQGRKTLHVTVTVNYTPRGGAPRTERVALKVG